MHDITLPAFEAAADPDSYPDAGEPWRPLKLYYTAWSRARIVALHERFLALGLESPFGRWLERPDQDYRLTTKVDVAAYDGVRRQALLAHATQIDPTSPFWFGLPEEATRDAYPYDDYILARSLVETSLPEDDLFAGVRERVTR